MLRAITLSLIGLLMIAPHAVASHGATVWVGSDDEAASVANLRYYPETVWVHAGGTVTWNSNSETPHTVTGFPPAGELFDSSPALTMDDPTLAAWFGPGGFLMPTQEFEQVFEQEGVFNIFCKIHPHMTMTVNVTASTKSPPVRYVDVGWGSGDTTVDQFAPRTLAVAPGTTVVFTNKHSAEPHTVTSADGGFDSSPLVGPPPESFFGPDGWMQETAANNVFTHVFSNPGSYPYFCKLHPGMWGTVLVMDAGDDAGPPPEMKVTPGLGAPFALVGLAAVGMLFRRRRT